MVGVGWVVLMDDWLGRGGPAGASLAFLVGGLLLLPVASTYGRLVGKIPDAGGEIAYAEGVFPAPVAFAAAWTMVLSYAIVCPWEAVAVGNLLARLFPWFNELPLYTVAGKIITGPRIAAGLLLTGGIAAVNYRGIRLSGVVQDVLTFGLLSLFAIFTALGFIRGEAAHLPPLFAQPGTAGALLSVLLVLQVVPYFMTGFESIGKESEEARVGFDPRHFRRAITSVLIVGLSFYVIIILAVCLVFPWQRLVAEHLGTEAAFARAFSSSALAKVILFAAFLSLVKIFNGNFVAATRLLHGIGRRGLVHGSLASIHPRRQTPAMAILLMAALTAGAVFLGDALLVPVTEVGSLAVGVGWLSTCLAFIARSRKSLPTTTRQGAATASIGAVVSLAIIVMKAWPSIPGSFTLSEWIAFALWSALGFVFWSLRKRGIRETP
jgi:basic amino acid/polyamine antiporter, APA family